MNICKRSMIALLLLTLFQAVHAQTYPSRPIRIVLGFAAGAPSDIVSRLLAQKMTERIGRHFIVENCAEATDTIGAKLMAKAPPDGYSLYLTSNRSGKPST